MGAILTDRDSLERAFYRLVNTDALDDALTEHDPDGYDREAVYQALQQGVWDAQHYLVDQGLGDRWLTASSAITSWTTEGKFRYSALPADFLRLAGDDDTSGVRDANGEWGTLLDSQFRHRAWGDYYWLQKERLYVAEGASIPSTGLYLDYIFRHPTLEATTEVDIPERERGLIVAYAAVHALEEDWVAGTQEMELKVARNLSRRESAAVRRARLTRKQRKFRPEPTRGSHWF